MSEAGLPLQSRQNTRARDAELQGLHAELNEQVITNHRAQIVCLPADEIEVWTKLWPSELQSAGGRVEGLLNAGVQADLSGKGDGDGY